ncbi:MAG: hypothetical protein KAS58_06950 [Calditrichia bacterium]|nr:hypothetical protein [Calditrichia bacterium]
MNTRSTRNQPFCWQEKKVLRLLKEKFKGSELAKLRNLYLTITQMDSDFNGKHINWYTKSLSTYSGLSVKWIPTGLKVFENLNIVKIIRNRDKYGRFQIGELIFTPDSVAKSKTTDVPKPASGKPASGRTPSGKLPSSEDSTSKEDSNILEDNTNTKSGSISLSSKISSEDIKVLFNSQRTTEYIPANITEYEQHLGINGSADNSPGNGSADADALPDVDYMNDAVKLHYLLNRSDIDNFQKSKIYELYVPQLLIRRPHLAVKLLDKFINHPKIQQISPEQIKDFEETAYVHYQAWEAEKLQQNNDQQEDIVEEDMSPVKPSRKQLEYERIKELADGFEKHFPATA